MTDRTQAAGLGLPTNVAHRGEIDDLRARLREAEETIEAIRCGEVDAVVVGGALGPQVYTLTNADRPYRLLIEQMKEGAITLSTAGLIVYCNDAFALLLGQPSGHVCGTLFQQFIRQTDIALFESLLNNASGGRVVLTLVGTGTTEVPVNLSLSLLPDNGEGRIVCGIVTDLRQLRQSTQDLADAGVRLANQIVVSQRAEALLHQAQKMEVVGQLAGGVAHDFNNLLTIISGTLDLIRKRVNDVRITGWLDQVLIAVQRGAKLTQQLLAFSRIQSLSPQSICLNDLLPDIEMLVRRAVGSEIDVRFKMVEEPWSCRVDPNQLQSAILNLAINARDAMPKGGSLTIVTENNALDDNAAADLGEVAPGRYVSVTMTDTGTGMTPEILSRVFDPIFTTKEVGKGSGLGLSQVYGFARQSAGHITLQSDVGKGTAVRLYLPWTERTVVPVMKDAEPVESVLVSYTKILIVEDDNDLRELTTQLVEGLGYATCSASTGAEAIATLERDSGIDFIFTDILMPGGMNGFDLAAEVRRRRPGMAILLTSGFPGYFLPGALPRDDFVIIRKPFTQTELAAAFVKVQSLPSPGVGRL